MFSLHKKTDYALTAIFYLSKETDRYMPLWYLIDKTHMPQRFLARITADLVRASILESKEGRSGGYKLLKDLKNITLFDFLELFEDEVQFMDCQKPGYKCEREGRCKHRIFFRKRLAQLLSNELKKITLADVLR